MKYIRRGRLLIGRIGHTIEPHPWAEAAALSRRVPSSLSSPPTSSYPCPHLGLCEFLKLQLLGGHDILSSFTLHTHSPPPLLSLFLSLVLHTPHDLRIFMLASARPMPRRLAVRTLAPSDFAKRA